MSVERLKARKPTGEPLRTLIELAEEFGVTHGSLRKRLADRDGPKCKRSGANTSGHKNYYEPSLVRKWWKEVGSA